MKILCLIFRPFYSVESRTSEAQLLLDFGDFPPAPLRCNLSTGEFRIVRTWGIGDVYFELIKLNRVLKAFESEPHALSQEFLQYYGTEAVYELRHILDGLRKFPRFIKSTLVTFIFAIKAVGLLVARPFNKPKGMGLFTPVFNNESSILIRTARFKGKTDESVISHEHIHLLQHRHLENHSRNIKSQKKQLSEEYAAEPFCLYLFEKDEVEARLHEVILSYYRTHLLLPLTVQTFLGALNTSSQFNWLIHELLNSHGVDFEKNIGGYSDRDAMLTEQLLFTFQWLKTDELRVKFLTEVLTVMYGNLLRYYGDDASSHAFLSQIPRPNYYDELYGE
jgi:hypothetical protein